MRKRMLTLTLILAMALGLFAAAVAAEKDTGFADVPAGADYAEAVKWCYDQKLMNGVGEGKFDPNGTLTRAMMATVLYRAAGSPDISNEIWGYPFADVEAGSWYATAVYWGRMNDILQGYGDDVFGTNDPVSVEQLEVILGRYRKTGVRWTGDSAKAKAATRAQVAAAMMAAFRKEDRETETGKVLVAYFSATNNTKGIAEKIAEHLGADLYEITPAAAYTSADLNYSNSSCRANREQNDPDARPEIKGDVENWDSYDVVFLGYPIWWGVPPKIMHTFMESHDFGGKTVIPFCTSGSSGYNDSNIKSLASSGVNWITGQRFSGSAGASTVRSWVDGLKLER